MAISAVRLPGNWIGIDGRIAEAFNQTIDHEEHISQRGRAAERVGRQGRAGSSSACRCPGSIGGWAAKAESVNTLLDDLVRPTTDVARTIGAVAKGDLGQSMELEVDGRPLKGEFLRSAKLVNTMIEQLSVFTSEVTRVAREVGTEGKLGGQAQVQGVSGVWKELTESVNQMAGNLTAQVRNIADVTIAVANGDLSKKITVDVRGEILQLKEAINTMVDQLRSFASEVTRVAREVGTEGRLGGQAVVPGVAGTWKDLTDSVNAMASNLTAQVRNIAAVTTAVARGDLSRKITVDVKGEILELKETINTMVDQLNGFSSEVTRVAREVGTEGKLGGQAAVPGVAGTWKDLTDSVNSMASNLTAQVRNIAEVTTAVAKGDLSRKITVDVKGEILALKNTINTMVDQLNGFASEVTRVAREVGTEGKLGGQAEVPGVAGTWKDLTDNVNFMASNLTGQVRNIAEVTTAVANGDLSKKITVDVNGEILELKNTINTMVDQLNGFASEVTRVAREVGTEGELGGQAEVRGVAGTWKDLTDSVNAMATNLTSQVRNIAEVTTAVANGNLSKKITVAVRGEILELKNTINTMVDQLNAFAGEVSRVAREVGTEGKLGGQAQVPGVAGTWKDLTDNVNSMASNLTGQVRNIADVATAVANGDLSKKITVDVKGEILELKNTLNTMVDQLNAFASEVTRVAREVGTEGKLGGQAQVPGVAGTWKDLTDNVNSMASNLTAQVRNIAEVTTAVAKGDLSRKITVDVKGEILELKNTINTMVDQLNGFASEVTRVAREVGTEGKLGGQAQVPGVAGTWKDLTDNVNFMASNLTGQVRNIAEVTTAVANGDLSSKITVDVNGEILQLKKTINTMVDQLNGFASEVSRVAREVGTEGKLGGQAAVRRRGRHLEGSDRQRQLDGLEPHLPGPQHRRSDHRRGQRRLVQEDHRRRARRNPGAEGNHQHDGRSAPLLRGGSDPRGPRSRHRRQAGRPGPGARRGRHLEGSHRQRQLDGLEPHRPGPQHRRRGHGHRPRRPEPQDHRRREGRDFAAQGNHEHDGRAARRVRLGSDPRGPRSRHRRQAGRPGGGARRGRHVEGSDRQRQLDGLQPHRPGAQHRRSDDRRGQRRPFEEDHRRRARRNFAAQGNHQHDGRAAPLVRLGSDPRGPRGRHRRAAGRAGGGARRGRHLEGPDRLGQHDGLEPHGPGPQHRRSDHRRGARRLEPQDHRRREGRNPGAEEHHQHDGRSAQRLRLGSDARGARSRHRRQARRPGAGLRRGRHLEGSHRQRQLHGLEPHRPGARHREGGDGRGRRQLAPEADRAGQGRSRRAGRHDQQHDRHAGDLLRAGDQRRPRGGRGRPARRSGQRARRGRLVEGPDRQREPAGRQSHDPGARHRRGRHRRDQGRPDAFDSGGNARRSRRVERQHQHDDRQPARDDRAQPGAGLAEDERRPIHQHAAGPARPGHGRQDAAGRPGAAGAGPAGRDLSDDHGRRRSRPRCSCWPAMPCGPSNRAASRSAKGWSANARWRSSASC